MTIDITKLRENVAKEYIGLWVDPIGIILALCDELDQARADVLMLRYLLAAYKDTEIEYPEVTQGMADTESYEQHR